MTGGIVSLGPPLGGVVVFAQECENIIVPKMIPTGMIGKYFSNILFILQVSSDYALDTLDLLKLLHQFIQVTHIVYI